jgi:hydrogenase maturation protease
LWFENGAGAVFKPHEKALSGFHSGMVKTLIIGYGNTLRQDDGLGPAAAEALSRMQFAEPVEVILCQQLTPELAADLSAAERVAFIDAAEPGPLPAGTIRKTELLPCPPAASGVTHYFDPATLLALAGALYQHTPQAALFTMTAASFGLSETFTGAVQQALPDLIQAVARWVDSPVEQVQENQFETSSPDAVDFPRE